METTIKNFKNKWVQIIVFVIAFSATPIIIEHYYLESLPAEHWFVYDSIQVNNEVSFEDSTIDVISFAEIKRPVRIEWIDTLYCNKGGGFEFVLTNESGKFYEKPTILPRVDINPDTEKRTLIPWRFDTDEQLEKGELCHIVSTISAIMPSGIEDKTQTVQSNDFIIK